MPKTAMSAADPVEKFPISLCPIAFAALIVAV
jgi:hypothetical protein